MKLFEDDLGNRQGEPLEDIEITTTILYMSRPELREFKTLAKIGIKDMFQEAFQQKGNLTDFILTLMREKYGSTETSAKASL